MPRISKIKKGGSRASNAVMALKPEVCMDYTTPVIEGRPINCNAQEFSLYRTTGGGKKNKSNKKRNYRKNKRGGSKASNAVTKLGRACNTSNKHVGGAKLSTHSSAYSTHPALADCNFANYLSAEEQQDLADGVVNETVNVGQVNVDGETPTLEETQVPLVGGGSSDWKSTLYSRGSYIAPNMPVQQFRAFTQQADYIPNESMRSAKFMKGGKRTYKKGKGRNNRVKKNKRTARRNNQKRSKSKSRRNQRGSGSSDWRSTLYSRGSYTAPNMPVDQFRAFTKQADYLPNESMRSAAFMK